MKKLINVNLYTETKTVWNKHVSTIFRNDDGALFSHGRYKTKILPEELPKWYVKRRYYKQFGYLSAKGVKDLFYHPNFFTNHMFKDDFLFISYDRKIISNPNMFSTAGADERIFGSVILLFLRAAEEYSGYDISEVKREIEKKRIWFRENYPDYYAQEVGRKTYFLTDISYEGIMRITDYPMPRPDLRKQYCSPRFTTGTPFQIKVFPRQRYYLQ